MSIFKGWNISLLIDKYDPRPRLRSNSAPITLTESQRQMYQKETTENFRHVAQIFASKSPVCLGEKDLVDVELQKEISDIGQFAELAHGKVDPTFVWRHLDQFLRPGFPLESYSALRGTRLISSFYGNVAKLQAYIAYRPETKQLIVAFSGTSSFQQTIHNADFRLVPYPGVEPARVHAGFYQCYQGIANIALRRLSEAIASFSSDASSSSSEVQDGSKEISEIVITAHSLGAAMCYLFAMDLIDTTRPIVPQTIPLKLVVFGSPRIGNDALAQHWHTVVEGRRSFVQCSIRGYNDGVTAVPPYYFGYRHFSSAPLYFNHGLLYQIPSSESEFTSFNVDSPEPNPASPHTIRQPFLEHPLGGHNYYNSRDMENVLRAMAWFQPLNPNDSKAVDWDAYCKWLGRGRA